MESAAASAKALAIDGMQRFLRDFSFIPDDKLTWSPTPTAKPAIRIAAHTALYPARFAHFIRTRELPRHDNLEEWLAKRTAEEVAITTRAQVEEAFRKGTDEVLAAIDSLTEEEIAMDLDSGFGWSMPMKTLMNLSGMHSISHGAQLDYLQTCWDDQEVHF